MKDLTGKKFGKFTVAWPVGLRGQKVQWLCFCSCGQSSIVASSNLSNGHSRSCGCISTHRLRVFNRSDKMRKGTIERNYKHGHAHRRGASGAYISYQLAKRRCNNPRDISFKNYGRKGIRFLFKDFKQFYAELGDRPENKSLDRFPNPSGHYEPGNVRWATRLEQRHNRSVAC